MMGSLGKLKELDMKIILTILLFSFYIFSCGENIRINKELSEYLKPFENYIGKTFKGEFSNSTPENPVYDISHWDRALNGNAIHIMHSVNNGEYGGESIIMWDDEKESLISWYFTTAGFYTQASLQFEDDKLISVEAVKGNKNGITQVKAVIEFLSDGQLLNSSMYFVNGNWVDGHKIHYKEEPDGKVVFK